MLTQIHANLLSKSVAVASQRKFDVRMFRSWLDEASTHIKVLISLTGNRENVIVIP